MFKGLESLFFRRKPDRIGPIRSLSEDREAVIRMYELLGESGTVADLVKLLRPQSRNPEDKYEQAKALVDPEGSWVVGVKIEQGYLETYYSVGELLDYHPKAKIIRFYPDEKVRTGRGLDTLRSSVNIRWSREKDE